MDCVHHFECVCVCVCVHARVMHVDKCMLQVQQWYVSGVR